MVLMGFYEDKTFENRCGRLQEPSESDHARKGIMPLSKCTGHSLQTGNRMMRTFLAVITVIALVSSVQSLAEAQPAEPFITQMGNGLTVIIREDHAAELVGVAVWVKAGSSNETEKNNGVSHFIEHLVFGATAKREPGEMDLEMESIGATLNARTSKDWAQFNTVVSSRYLRQALDVLADAMTAARFRDQDIEQERRVILDEIAKKETNPIAVCKDYLARELYGSHPYSLPVEGTRESVLAISRQDIVDYYRKYYVPRNMAVVLVGDVDKERAVAEIGRAFQGLAGAPAPKQSASEIAPITQQVNKTLKAPLDSTCVAVGFHGPPGADYKDVCAIDVLLAYLGFGYRSWMAEALKGKMALATEVSADFLTQRHPGAISLIVQTTDANVEKVKGAIFARIAAIRNEGLAESDLALAKRSLLGQYAFENETYGGMAASYGFYFAVSEPQFASKYVECVQSIRNEDIIRAAQKYLDPTRAVVLIIGPNQGGNR